MQPLSKRARLPCQVTRSSCGSLPGRPRRGRLLGTRRQQPVPTPRPLRNPPAAHVPARTQNPGATPQASPQVTNYPEPDEPVAVPQELPNEPNPDLTVNTDNDLPISTQDANPNRPKEKAVQESLAPLALQLPNEPKFASHNEYPITQAPN
jgi:hypothetical protein